MTSPCRYRSRVLLKSPIPWASGTMDQQNYYSLTKVAAGLAEPVGVSLYYSAWIRARPLTLCGLLRKPTSRQHFDPDPDSE
jgi:hypothetical protein